MYTSRPPKHDQHVAIPLFSTKVFLSSPPFPSNSSPPNHSAPPHPEDGRLPGLQSPPGADKPSARLVPFDNNSEPSGDLWTRRTVWLAVFRLTALGSQPVPSLVDSNCFKILYSYLFDIFEVISWVFAAFLRAFLFSVLFSICFIPLFPSRRPPKNAKSPTSHVGKHRRQRHRPEESRPCRRCRSTNCSGRLGFWLCSHFKCFAMVPAFDSFSGLVHSVLTR